MRFARVLNIATAVALVAGAVGFAYSLSALLDPSESLGGLVLIFWAIVFVPVFVVLGAIHLWRASRRKAP